MLGGFGVESLYQQVIGNPSLVCDVNSKFLIPESPLLESPPPCMSVGERFYTVAEISGRLKLSPDKVRRIFHNERGVVVFENRLGGRRRYSTLRIPESVLERVIRRCQKP